MRAGRIGRAGATMLAALASVAADCGGDWEFREPTIEEAAGDYRATEFRRIVDQAIDVDYIEAGGEIVLVLHEDGTTTGHLVMPGGGASGDDVEATRGYRSNCDERGRPASGFLERDPVA